MEHYASCLPTTQQLSHFQKHDVCIIKSTLNDNDVSKITQFYAQNLRFILCGSMRKIVYLFASGALATESMPNNC